ncbi:MAG: HD domain-containing protein [Planctomycetota bacterium]|nr:HD domain-containing protein [Planctomycetota bacterium]MDI6786783.1 HD domain-containing protein [Planctomycetota bacterium]
MDIKDSVLKAILLLDSAKDNQQILLEISEQILTHAGAPGCIFFSCETDEVIPDILTVFSPSNDQTPSGIKQEPISHLGAAQTMSKWVAENGRLLILNSSDNDIRYQEEIKMLGSLSVQKPVIASIPLICTGSLIGIMDIIFNPVKAEHPECLRGNWVEEKIQSLIPLINIASLIYARRYSDGLTKLAEVSVQLLEGRDYYTHGHSLRVTNYCLMIAEELGLSEVQKQKLRLASLLHDIGKLSFSDTLFKADRALSKLELKLIEMHPLVGANIVSEINKSIALIIRHHHEHYDGSGYPHGIKEQNIPLLSRIIAVSDALDAMLSERPYQKSIDMKHAIEELKTHSGTQFDPLIVDVLIRCYHLGRLSSTQMAY